LPKGSLSATVNSLKAIGVEISKETAKRILFEVKSMAYNEDLMKKLNEIDVKQMQEDEKRRREEGNKKEANSELESIYVRGKNGEIIEISLENRVLVPLVSHVRDVNPLPYFKMKILQDVLHTHGCDFTEKLSKRNCELFNSRTVSDSESDADNMSNEAENANKKLSQGENTGGKDLKFDCNVCSAPVIYFHLRIEDNPDILDILDPVDILSVQKAFLEEIPVLTLDIDTFFDVYYVFMDPLKGNKVVIPKEVAERRRDELKKKGMIFIDKSCGQSYKKVKRFICSIFELITFRDTKEIFFYDNGVYREGGEDLITTFCVLFGFANSRKIIEEIKNETLIERKNLENKWLICLENGVLDLRTFEVKPHNPKYLMLNKIPVKYDPDADCPKIKQFLRAVLHEEDIPVIEELFGYCLLKDYPIHKAFMLLGNGANGKSTLINLLKAFLGAENCSSVSLQALSEDKFSIAELYGKLANLYADVPDEALRSTGTFKMLTGGDTITAQRKFQHPFQFRNYAKLIFSANKLPEARDDSDAFFRRWILINFPNRFEGDKRDPNILKKLTTPEELSGLLNLALRGLKRLLEQGDFSRSKSTDELRKQYVRMSDSVAAFCEDMIEQDPESYVSKKDLYAAYCEYCRQNKLPIVSDTTFHKKLRKHVKVEDYRPKIRDRRITAWRGIALKKDKGQRGESYRCKGCGAQFSDLAELGVHQAHCELFHDWQDKELK